MLPPLREPKEILYYGHWLMMRGQLAGNLTLNGHTATEEELSIESEMRLLADLASKRLTNCKPEAIGELLDCYDWMHRLGYKSIPNQAFVNKVRKRYFSAWMNGKKEIEESNLFCMLSRVDMSEVDTNDKLEYDAARRAIRNKWLETLRRHSYFPDATTHENYQRLSLVMRANISDRFNGKSEAMKRKWYERNKVEDLTTLSTQILRAYRQLSITLFPDVMDLEPQCALDNHILAELIARPDLNLYDREAFRLALKHNKVETLKHQL